MLAIMEIEQPPWWCLEGSGRLLEMHSSQWGWMTALSGYVMGLFGEDWIAAVKSSSPGFLTLNTIDSLSQIILYYEGLSCTL